MARKWLFIPILMTSMCACAGGRADLSFIPPGFHYEVYRPLDAKEKFELTEASISNDDKTKWKMTFYESGYLKSDTIPNDFVDKDGHTEMANVQETYWQPKSTLKSLIFPKDILLKDFFHVKKNIGMHYLLEAIATLNGTVKGGTPIEFDENGNIVGLTLANDLIYMKDPFLNIQADNPIYLSSKPPYFTYTTCKDIILDDGFSIYKGCVLSFNGEGTFLIKDARMTNIPVEGNITFSINSNAKYRISALTLSYDFSLKYLPFNCLHTKNTYYNVVAKAGTPIEFDSVGRLISATLANDYYKGKRLLGKKDSKIYISDGN